MRGRLIHAFKHTWSIGKKITFISIYKYSMYFLDMFSGFLWIGLGKIVFFFFSFLSFSSSFGHYFCCCFNHCKGSCLLIKLCVLGCPIIQLDSDCKADATNNAQGSLNVAQSPSSTLKSPKHWVTCHCSTVWLSKSGLLWLILWNMK